MDDYAQIYQSGHFKCIFLYQKGKQVKEEKIKKNSKMT